MKIMYVWIKLDGYQRKDGGRRRMSKEEGIYLEFDEILRLGRFVFGEMLFRAILEMVNDKIYSYYHYTTFAGGVCYVNRMSEEE